jgi:hypothetical protein
MTRLLKQQTYAFTDQPAARIMTSPNENHSSYVFCFKIDDRSDDSNSWDSRGIDPTARNLPATTAGYPVYAPGCVRSSMLKGLFSADIQVADWWIHGVFDRHGNHVLFSEMRLPSFNRGRST